MENVQSETLRSLFTYLTDNLRVPSIFESQGHTFNEYREDDMNELYNAVVSDRKEIEFQLWEHCPDINETNPEIANFYIHKYRLIQNDVIHYKIEEFIIENPSAIYDFFDEDILSEISGYSVEAIKEAINKKSFKILDEIFETKMDKIVFWFMKTSLFRPMFGKSFIHNSNYLTIENVLFHVFEI